MSDKRKVYIFLRILSQGFVLRRRRSMLRDKDAASNELGRMRPAFHFQSKTQTGSTHEDFVYSSFLGGQKTGTGAAKGGLGFEI